MTLTCATTCNGEKVVVKDESDGLPTYSILGRMHVSYDETISKKKKKKIHLFYFGP